MHDFLESTQSCLANLKIIYSSINLHLIQLCSSLTTLSIWVKCVSGKIFCYSLPTVNNLVLHHISVNISCDTWQIVVNRRLLLRKYIIHVQLQRSTIVICLMDLLDFSLRSIICIHRTLSTFLRTVAWLISVWKNKLEVRRLPWTNLSPPGPIWWLIARVASGLVLTEYWHLIFFRLSQASKAANPCCAFGNQIFPLSFTRSLRFRDMISGQLSML